MAPIISFKAGRATRRGETNHVDPSPAKGLIYMQEEDGLLHFCYKDLETNAVDDLIIFPGDATFSAVAPRIYVLKFSSSSHRHFFWLQDIDTSKDEERTKKVNQLMSGEEEEEEPVRMEVEADPIASTSSTNLPPVTSTTALGTSEQMAQLRDILAGMSSGNPLASAMSQQSPQYLLTDILTPSTLSPLLSSSLSSHIPFLPPTLPPTHSTLSRIITSREFKRSVASLERALRTGALGPLVAGLGLGQESAEGLEAFLEGVQRQAEEEKKRVGGDAKEVGEAKMDTDP